MWIRWYKIIKIKSQKIIYQYQTKLIIVVMILIKNNKQFTKISGNAIIPFMRFKQAKKYMMIILYDKIKIK